MKSLDYIDHTVSTRREWTQAREVHMKKLLEIVRSPSKKAYTPLPKIVEDSKSRLRSLSKIYTEKLILSNLIIKTFICISRK